jgi:DNA-binding SARP family transcriptional activator/TolB-like protein
VESARFDGSDSGIAIRMLGPLAVARHGVPADLPTSRKARALLAYLALQPTPVGRSRLCDIFWDVPSDPRGELRWCLSKLRGVLDDAEQIRVETPDDGVHLGLADCFLDATVIAAAVEGGLDALDPDELHAMSRLFAGEFLEGLDLDRSPLFNNWLIAQRRRFRAYQTAIIEHLSRRLPPASDEAIACLGKWVELAPFDRQANVALLSALLQRGRISECEEQLAAGARLFEAEALDFRPVRDAWRALRERRTGERGAAVAAGSEPPPAPVADPAGTPLPGPRRASLAVMPFAEDGSRGGLADGLVHDIITRLARLRDIFVIARGSVFALSERGIGPEDAGRRLNVDYVASGKVEHRDGRVVVKVELVEVRTARIVWADQLEQRIGLAFDVLDEIGNRIVASISSEIELNERNQAVLKTPNSLDAWEAYHRGLWHMYRFTRDDNASAQHFFRLSVRLDPTFARAHAGLSFTHWQSAFQRWGDRDEESSRAFDAAGQSVLADDHNPAAHWAMGRALWLRGQSDNALVELRRSVDLSPNFALGHYALSFVQSQSGDPTAAIRASDYSRLLSPFDPLLFGMMGARAMAHVRLGEFEEAAEWAMRAAARPNAHVIILAIAAHCLALAGRIEEARKFSAAIRTSLPDYRSDDFLATFRFTPDAAALFRQGGKRIGFV